MVKEGQMSLGTTVKEGQMSVGTMVKDGQMSVGTMVKGGQVSVGTFVKDGQVSVGTIVKEGQLSVGTMVKDGQVSVGTMVKDGQMSVATMVKDGKCLSVRWLMIVPCVVEGGGVFHVQILLTSHKRNLLKPTDCGSTLTAPTLLSLSSRTKVKAFRRQPRAWTYISGYIKDIMYVDSRVSRSRSVNCLGHVYLQRKFLTRVVHE